MWLKSLTLDSLRPPASMSKTHVIETTGKALTVQWDEPLRGGVGDRLAALAGLFARDEPRARRLPSSMVRVFVSIL